MIYLDHAATTPLDPRVLDAMMPYLTYEFGNPGSLHAYGKTAREAVDKARGQVAQFFHCDPQQVIFTSGGSEADNQAILSAARLGLRNGKKHIISTPIEHHAVLHTLEKLKKEGYEITLLPVSAEGLVDPADVAAAIREDTCLVTVMYANNEIGTVEPIRAIGEICREKKVLFHTDAVQAIGHVPVNVVEDNVDLLSASAHKFHGPKGTGFLYARKGVRLTNLIEGGAQERGKRAGTENVDRKSVV